MTSTHTGNFASITASALASIFLAGALLIGQPAYAFTPTLSNPLAQARWNAGYRAQQANRNEDAETEYRAALAILDRPSDARDRTYVMNRLADALRLQDKLTEAETVARRSLKLSRSLFAPMTFEAFDAHFTLGGVLLELGTPEQLEAVQLLIQAENVLSELSVSEVGEIDLMGNRSALGQAFSKLGEFDRAEMLLLSVIPYWEQRGAAGRTALADAQYSLGHSYFGRGRFDQSEPAFRRALLLFKADKREDDRDVRDTRFMLGRSLWGLQHLPEAERELRRALVHARRAESDNETLGLYVLSLGVVLVEMERWEEGLRLTQEAYDLTKTALNHDPSTLAQALAYIGRAHRGLGRTAEAVTALRDGLNIFQAYPEPLLLRVIAATHLAELSWNAREYCQSQKAYKIALADAQILATVDELSVAEFRQRIDWIQKSKSCSGTFGLTVAEIAELYNRKHPEGPHVVVIGGARQVPLWAAEDDPDALLKILQKVDTLVVTKSDERITVRLVAEPTSPE